MKTQIKLSKWCLANKPSLLDEWDYDKNDDIENYTYGSNKKVWWFCRYGHSYRMRINHKTVDDIGCPICSKERKTSFPEKAIFYYVKKFFADAEENKNFNWLGKKEVDIYIPSINVAIEYDGYHWHSNIEKDTIKDNICNSHNVILYRIRIEGCSNYDSNSIKIYYGKTYKIKDLDGAIKNFSIY